MWISSVGWSSVVKDRVRFVLVDVRYLPSISDQRRHRKGWEADISSEGQEEVLNICLKNSFFLLL